MRKKTTLMASQVLLFGLLCGAGTAILDHNETGAINALAFVKDKGGDKGGNKGGDKGGDKGGNKGGDKGGNRGGNGGATKPGEPGPRHT